VERVETSAQIAVRPLSELEDLREAVRLQQRVWNFADNELVPLRMFVVATKIGGQVLGAFDGERMAGFCLAIPALKQRGGLYLHSHMLGVDREYRDRHVGRALKLAQRADALSRGIKLIEWTFDPLEIKNAYFNLVRLGAVVRRYVYNQYGVTASPLHGGLPTDRCVAEWWIDSARVKALASGQPVEAPQAEARIEVPAEIETLRRERPEEARRIQSAVGEQFAECFSSRRLAAIGFERSQNAGTYLLGRWHSV
jgi:predicted GNAT superfamily acetyltransferase